MAGKLHKDFVRYRDGGGIALEPGRRARAYAEGYQARRRNALQNTNPHPSWQNTDQQSAWWAWDQGWRDGDALLPATHVGKPDVVL